MFFVHCQRHPRTLPLFVRRRRRVCIRDSNKTLFEEMARDGRVILIGEDVASEGGGAYGVSLGLAEAFGKRRVIDTPITESAIIGAAGGAALTGLRPVAELMLSLIPI